MNLRVGLTVLLLAGVFRFDRPIAVADGVAPRCQVGGVGNGVVLCDDFDDGSAGWNVNSHYNYWPVSDFVRCGRHAGFHDRCAAWSNALIFDGYWGYWGYDAWRQFPRLDDFYVRWYQYVSDGYVWGTLEDKSVMLHDPPVATITAYVAVSRNQLPVEPHSGPGMPFVANYQDVDYPETGWAYTKVNRFQNQGNDITLQPSRWYLFEWYVKLNTPGESNGVTRLWIDDASRPIASQTLRLAYDDMRWLRATDAGKYFGFLRLTDYHQRCDIAPDVCPPAGPAIVDQSLRWDHVAVSTHPIGPIPPSPRGRGESDCRDSGRPQGAPAGAVGVGQRCGDGRGRVDDPQRTGAR